MLCVDVDAMLAQVMPWAELDTRMQAIAALGDNEVKKRLDTVNTNSIMHFGVNPVLLGELPFKLVNLYFVISLRQVKIRIVLSCKYFVNHDFY